MEFIAIIPARSESKSITDKNIVPLSGYPLIAYSIAAAKLSAVITRVIVSTDSERYAKIAQRFGAEVPFIRPAEYSTDTSTDRDFLIHAMKWLENYEAKIPEFWVHLRPTTPLRDPAIVDQAIKEIQADRISTSLRSGHKATESYFKWFRKDMNGYFKGLFDGGEITESYNQPKEVFEDVYIPDGYVDIVRRSFVMENDAIHGERMIGFQSPVCTEVDSIEEFKYIQYQLSKRPSPLLSYLQNCKPQGAN